MMAYQLDDGWTTVNFVRPMRGLIAMHGNKVLKLNILGCNASNTTLGHRFESIEKNIVIKHADDYKKLLEKEGNVIPCFKKRRAKIEADIRSTLAKLGENFMLVRMIIFNEVTSLVERPNIIIGEFEDKYLSIPEECLILTMKTNQKYFPIFNKKSGLTNQFIVVSNISPKDFSQIAQGNEKVIKPRLADAEFFYNEDKKIGLDNFCKKLDNVIYHNKLGSQKDRAERVSEKIHYICKEQNIKKNR